MEASHYNSHRLLSFLITTFILSAPLGTLYFVQGFLKEKHYLTQRSLGRYELLSEAFSNTSYITQYIETEKKRPAIYKQIYINVIDGLWDQFINKSYDIYRDYKVIGREYYMRKTREFFESQPDKARFQTFYADAPTMTNARVEALGTGTHMPYFKLKNTLGNIEAIEDSFIEQIYKAGNTIVSIGDHLWVDLFAKKHFKR